MARQKAMATNLLVRLVTNDEQEQAERAAAAVDTGEGIALWLRHKGSEGVRSLWKGLERLRRAKGQGLEEPRALDASLPRSGGRRSWGEGADAEAEVEAAEARGGAVPVARAAVAGVVVPGAAAQQLGNPPEGSREAGGSGSLPADRRERWWEAKSQETPMASGAMAAEPSLARATGPAPG